MFERRDDHDEEIYFDPSIRLMDEDDIDDEEWEDEDEDEDDWDDDSEEEDDWDDDEDDDWDDDDDVDLGGRPRRWN